ncbi:hypothetical protein [Cupriavidus sp. D384]|uniref:hypothetical protein n=1 Tax=Cupriavidus sp. D384 TaxID=1538095 RepID=UPI000A9BC95C|nr:hypothetical protein [Cupriavidus sp. D384]
MASLPFEEGLGKTQSGVTLVAGYPVGRWTRYADMAAVAGVGLGLLAALFGILDYQRKVYGDMLKTEIGAVVSTMSEMDKRLSGEIVALDKKLSGEMKGLEARLGDKIDDTNRRIDETNQRLSGLEKEVGGINVRLGRLEGKVGK